MKWAHRAICDETGIESSTRTVVMMAGTTLSLCTLILTIMAWWKPEVVPALTVFGGGLATMAGGSYMAGRWSETRRFGAGGGE